MTYSVGIIGTGFGAKVHLPGFSAHPDFEVDLISGRSPKKTEEIARDGGIQGTTNWHDVVNSDVDLVAVTTPPFLHYSMAKQALAAGKHVLLEKPTTSNRHQARELASIAINKGLVGMMSHEFRWVPIRHYLANLVKTGKIGKLREIHHHNFYQFAALADQPQFGWLWDSRFDGGMLGAIGSHLVDQIRHTTDREFRTVSGYLTTRVKSRADGNGSYSRVTADDGFSLHFTLEDDVVGQLTVSTTMSPTPVSQFVLAGDQGVIKVSDNELYFAELGGEFEPLVVPEEFQLDRSLEEKDRRLPPFMRLLDQLSSSLDDGIAKSPSLTDGWKNQQVLDAVRDSHRTGSRMTISP